MTDPTHDPEFEEFLKRGRPLFRRDVDDGLEPPPELDRIVLRQARDAIQPEQPMRMYRGPRWAAPVAVAATLVVGLAVVFQVGIEQQQRIPEVTVEKAAQRLDHAEPPAAVPPATGASVATAESARADAANSSDRVVVELRAPMAEPQPATVARGELPPSAAMESAAAPAPAAAEAADAPAWRRDSQTWLAEIARLRAAGDASRADAEMAEYNRQHRAFAVSPDR
jgi:hypothetical protein